eukprot:Plantae.Rhodophyta-Rhodochaete_pulchella.ctg1157.p2 GENE.Plantae.Rhodophyta-Rhodochaete_pulchella.ctg1157~~Plantae.Rhodophyta-Rhodochaete_pulchella.ctg1157.p2  ORF type:complete len:103 (-),score=13.64 Plantae.Rhodophyta-Rhodochaete_pulchella.ctg1157:822-1130(-)
MTNWIDEQLNNRAIFPDTPGASFPENYYTVVNAIMRKLFRIYGHVFHAHLDEVIKVGSQQELCSSFRHFVYLAYEYGLLTARDFEPLKGLLEELQLLNELPP